MPRARRRRVRIAAAPLVEHWVWFLGSICFKLGDAHTVVFSSLPEVVEITGKKWPNVGANVPLFGIEPKSGTSLPAVRLTF